MQGDFDLGFIRRGRRRRGDRSADIALMRLDA
jgi:hypothetical protein